MGKLEEDAQKWRLFEAGHNTLGIYPQSVMGGEKPYKERTDYMNGWNAAVLAMHEARWAVEKVYGLLEQSVRDKLEELVNEDFVFWGFDDREARTAGQAKLAVAYTWADAEDLPLEEIERLHGLWKEYGPDGVIAWVANRRGEEPLAEYVTEKYKEARAALEAFKQVE
jgi:hypothetical protein